jgi:hypothetical protein
LRLLACCAPEAIPLRQLLQPRSGLTTSLGPQVEGVLRPLLEDPLAAKDAIAALRRYSLISPPVDGSVSVHRLVQAVTADQMSAGLPAWRQAAAAVIGAAIPEDPQRPDTWPDFAALLPHAQAALTADSIGMERIAAYLGFSGSYVTARELYRRVVEARERVLGPEHPDTLAARADLAWWTGDSGAAATARDQYAALLPIIERVLGPEHPQTLGARAGLADWTGRAGMRPRPATCSPRWCRSSSGRPARRTHGPWAPESVSPGGPGRRGMRPRPATSTPRCCPSASGC